MIKYFPKTWLEKVAYVWREFWAAFCVAVSVSLCSGCQHTPDYMEIRKTNVNINEVGQIIDKYVWICLENGFWGWIDYEISDVNGTYATVTVRGEEPSLLRKSLRENSRLREELEKAKKDQK